MRKTTPHLLGLAGFFIAGIINGFLYLLIVDELFGLRGDGFGNAAAVKTFPMFGLLVGIAWIAIWLNHERMAGPMSLRRVITVSLLLGLFAALLMAGPNGFTLRGGSALMNYFLIDLTAGAAIIHHLLCEKIGGDASPST